MAAAQEAPPPLPVRDPAAAQLARAKQLLQEALHLDENGEKVVTNCVFMQLVVVLIQICLVRIIFPNPDPNPSRTGILDQDLFFSITVKVPTYQYRNYWQGSFKRGLPIIWKKQE